MSRFYFAIVGALLALAIGPAAAQSPATTTITFLTWTEYMDPEIVTEFENKTGTKIKLRYYESDDDRTQILSASEGNGFDLVLSDGLSLRHRHKRGWLAPLDQSSIPNLQHADMRWRSAYPASDGFAVPYFWGTMGSAYRKDLIAEPISKWKQLLEPQESVRGKIAMIPNARDLVGIALKALGYSVNSNDHKQLAEAEALLQSQKPHVKQYRYITLGADSALLTGDIVATMIFNGDAVALREQNDNVVYVLPEEGGNVYADYLVVMASSQKQAQARAFIDFLNRPETARRLAEFVYYATPNKAAGAWLPQEFLADPVIYSDARQLDRSEFYKPLPPRTQKAVNSIVGRLSSM